MTLYVVREATSRVEQRAPARAARRGRRVAVTGTPTFGTGLTASMFSTITLSDGTKQLTVNGSPLYTWQGDTKAGDATGQGRTASTS